MKNKNIIKALAIGISASMALQPVTVLAEGEAVTPETGDLGGEGSHVEEVAQNPVEKSFNETEEVIQQADDAVEEAERDTGVEFDNSHSLIAVITGEVTSADELIDEAESDVETAEDLAVARDKAIADMEEAIEGEGQFNDNIGDAKQDFKDAKEAANEAQQLAEQVTEDSTQAEAQQLVTEAEAKYSEATEALVKAESEYQAALDAYDVAFAKYMEASAEGILTYAELEKAEFELAAAKQLVVNKKKEVEGHEANAKAAYENMLKEDYSLIQASADKLAKGETTKEAHAELLINSYIKRNGGKLVAENAFSTTDKGYVGENGEAKTNTYKTVTYIDAEGNTVTDIFDVTVGEDGNVAVNKITVEVVTDTDNVINPEVQEVKAGYIKADGTKVEESEDNKYEYKTVNEKEYAVYTGEAKEDKTNPAQISEDYTEVSSETKWVDDTYKSVVGYKQKTETENLGKASSLDDVKRMIAESGKNVKSVRVGRFIQTDYDINNPSFLARFINEVDKLLRVRNNFDVTVSYETDDTTKPIYEDVNGIAEVVETTYTKTTTEDKSYTYSNFWTALDARATKSAAEANAPEGATVGDAYWVKTSRFTGYYACNVTWIEKNTSTITVETSRKVYAADAVSKKVDAVAHQNAEYGTKLQVTTGDSLVENDLSTQLADQAAKLADQDLAVKQAEAATQSYYDAVKAVETARAKVEKLKKQNKPSVTLAAAQAELRAAMKKLGATYIAKNKAERAAYKAEAALAEANEELEAIIAKNRNNNPSNNDQPSGGDDTTGGDNTSNDTTPVINTVVSNTTVDNAEVLGANRSPARRAARANSTKTATESTEVTNDSSNAAVANDTNSTATEKETTTVETTATIADEDTAKAATPIETKKGFPYWVLIILAAISGVSVEEYVRRKNVKAKADGSKKN
ncbi:hypothetical protein [Butyrivibrio sp. VCB2001]|uniref:hypothetical protein n=1 Tax=Butyrivibrio sp. VCB2001 TaxID=1280667 RepID=UPI000426BFC2|nr:hypothetical protein [Butyrivibrio sp. VCB2001]